MSKNNNEKIYQWTSTFKSLGETEDGGVNIKGSARSSPCQIIFSGIRGDQLCPAWIRTKNRLWRMAQESNHRR